MKWKRMGHVFSAKERDGIGGSHAQVPTALVFENFIRVFYADRTDSGKSYISYVDLDRSDYTTVLYAHEKSILPLGKAGTFDDDGVMPSFALRNDDAIWLYYSGWNRGVTVPYRNSVGIAVSYDGGDTFQRLYEGPVLERTPIEPYLAVTPSILKVKNAWRMWYASGLGWRNVQGKFEPVYVIKNAGSTDGVNWERPNKICVPQIHANEAFARPTVIMDGHMYRMWFCARDSVDYRDGKGAYRIGYAESLDGNYWIRLDEKFGLGVSNDPWETTMTCYPFVLNIDGRIIMYYNGNSFGATGFGCAILGD